MGPDTLVPIAFFACVTIAMVARSRIGEAIADRIRGHSRDVGGDFRAEIEQLRGELEGVRQELGEVAERLDFTERLLAQTRETDRLAKPR